MSEKAVLLEVKVLVTAYMRRAHGLALEVDESILADLIGVAPSTPMAGLEIKILEVTNDTSVHIAIPLGWPIVDRDSGNGYVAAHIAGMPAVGKKFADLAQMTTSEPITRWVRMSKKVTADLKAGMVISLEKLSGESTSPTPAPTPTPKADKPAKPTRETRRLADHKALSCTCQRPPGHECPYVTDFGGTILSLEVVLEKIAADKAA